MFGRFIGLLGLMALMAGSGAEGADKKLTFLHVNDVYELQPRDGLGGVAYLGTILREYRQKDPQLLFTFGGDLLSPSLLSGLVKGGQMVEAMNLLGMELAVPGNHEFDFGPENMQQQLAASKASWLAANMGLKSGTPYPGTKRNLIREVHGIPVGFFGVITPQTATSSKPGREIAFTPVLETARQQVAELKGKGAKMIVALTHLLLHEDRQLAAEVPGIDLILGGHDHDPMAIYEKGVLIVKSGSDNQYITVVEAVEEHGTHPSWQFAWQVRPVGGVLADPVMQAMVDRYQTMLDKALGKPLLTLAKPFDSVVGSVRGGENALGNLVTDAMREAVGAEVALFNGGGLRGNRSYPVGYSLSQKDLLTELPFGNVTMLLEIKGKDLWTVLESTLSQIEQGGGRFPQISGMNLVYDPTRPTGERLLEVTVGKVVLALDRTYKLATTDYLAGGNDGYDALQHGRVLLDASNATLVTNHIKEYLLAHPDWQPALEGRIATRK
ncbi:MAG: 5'-nucleotidase C-terminal domain-containing protein [Magnetococcales bacterium]|nr:5'-nucleotidase C-terminal domain-containing protein [Magnetococcales bacterium]